MSKSIWDGTINVSHAEMVRMKEELRRDMTRTAAEYDLEQQKREEERKRLEYEKLWQLTKKFSPPSLSRGYHDYTSDHFDNPELIAYNALSANDVLTLNRFCLSSYRGEVCGSVRLVPHRNEGRVVSGKVMTDAGWMQIDLSVPKSIQTWQDTKNYGQYNATATAGWKVVVYEQTITPARAKELVEQVAKPIVERIANRWLHVLVDDDTPNLDVLVDQAIAEFAAQDRKDRDARSKITQHLLNEKEHNMQPKAPPKPVLIEGQGDW